MGQDLDSDVGLALNLSAGSLTRSGAGRVLPIPARLFGGLVSALSEEELRRWGRSWGQMLGLSLVGEGAQPRSSQWVVDRLTREFALWGLGQPTLEQWGRALVVVVREPVAQPVGALLLAGVVEGALREAFAQPRVEVLVVEGGAGQEPDPLRLLVCGPRAAERVRQAQSEGVAWAQVVAEFNRVGARSSVGSFNQEQAN